ncbi:toll/interleukin-1 receptor domain-containing protein [Tengunoibacter tsumagoiensis]|uniref:TIR domain-containing protein n=1 Tax=Tengunoibacter tsumagoiensis TaxID=2014871 RepID=A0A401ZV50_9CHLR|nr:toll/interleukin-1 receptor domain-containing protein [Tengunoibacter tsumagoiensis]GCE10818.1 hypothetical protein KTT_06770 [Tengunoibacter tsumagoiensis]
MSHSPEAQRPGVKVFYSYSHKDEDLREELQTHLALMRRQQIIAEWHDRALLAGDTWPDEIDEHLETADVILLLISANFIASEYCYGKEMKRALERREAGEALVIPIYLKSTDMKGAPFASIQGVPRDQIPVVSSRWHHRDEAWLHVTKALRAAITNWQEKKQTS